MIGAVCTTKNEADIIGYSVAHLLAEGVDLIFVADASTDETREVLAKYPVTVIPDDEPYHYQPEWTKTLAGLAHEQGATWILPFDADEFTYAPGRSLAEFFAALPDDVAKVYIQMIQHRDWNWRYVNKPKPLPKVAWRWHPDAQPHAGNHECDVPGRAVQGLELREIMYRSEAQFVRKVRERAQTLDPDLPVTAGTHHRILNEYSDEELAGEWARMQEEAVTWEPIPSRSSFHTSVPHG